MANHTHLSVLGAMWPTRMERAASNWANRNERLEEIVSLQPPTVPGGAPSVALRGGVGAQSAGAAHARQA